MSTTGLKRISTGYEPRPLQEKLHQSLKRFNVLVCHRRFGKTVFCINEMVDRGLRFQMEHPEFKNPRYAYLAPLYGQAKRVAWDYLKMYTANIPGAVPNEADLRVDLPHNGCRFTLLGADNPASLKGIYLDGVILDEYAEMNPAAWREVIRPTLSDRGGWAIFIGTPKGQNAFYETFERAKGDKSGEWFAAKYKASESGILKPAELASAKAEMTEEEYEQEFECSFSAGLVGAYFSKELLKAEIEQRIAFVPHDPMIPVDTYWDLGINDTTSVWFIQTIRGVHRIIRYYEICGASLPDILADVRKFGYNLDEFVLPHDAAARDLSTGKSQQQVFWSLGARRTRIVPRVGSKRDSINAARMIFNSCIFDEQNTKQGLKALAQYQRKWNPKNNVFEEAPLHNWASNGADAFQCFAMGVRSGSSDISVGGRFYDGSQAVEAETEFDIYE